MSTNDGAVDKQMFHVWVIDKMLMHTLPDIFVTPAGKPFVYTVPVAVPFWQQSPLSTAAGEPQDRFDESTAMGFLTDVYAGAGAQELENL